MNEYFHTTITQWPGNKDITPEIHEAIWDWLRRASVNVGEEALIDEATAIFEKIGTRMAPAEVAARAPSKRASLAKEVR